MPGDEVRAPHSLITRSWADGFRTQLETSMWLSDESGGKRVDFVQKIKNTGKVCLGGGVALILAAGPTTRPASKL